MTKFESLIADTSNNTLKRRAAQITQTAVISQQNLVNSLKQQKSSLELKIADLTDFAPNTKDSLRPNSTGWDADEWVRELQETKESLYQINLSLKIAEETYKEFFDETA